MLATENKNNLKITFFITAGIIIILAFVVGIIFQTNNSYKKAINNAKSDSANLVYVASKQIETSFREADDILYRAVEEKYHRELQEDNLHDYTLYNIETLVNDSPSIVSMLLTDAQGKPIIAAHKKNYEKTIDYDNYSFADNNIFKKAKDSDAVSYFIGKLYPDSDLIIMARSVANVEGNFAGIFAVVIDPKNFGEYFKAISHGAKNYISLKMAESGESLFENQHNYYELNEEIAADQKKATSLINVGMSKFNGKNIIYAYKKLSYPLVVTIAVNEEDYLSIWRQNTINNIGLFLVILLFSLSLYFFAKSMLHKIAQAQKSEAAAVLASQAKSEFLANMSHELRTPLNAIIGFSEMMNSGYFGLLNPKQKERINDINLCGSHLLNLINDILEFSKGNAGKLELVEEKVVMREIVEETIRMMNEKIKEKHMRVIVDVSEEVPDILGDKRKIRQILLNLLSNAVKFTPEDGTVKLSIKQDANQNVNMTVSDTGIGIAEKDIPTALSVFGQVHRNYSLEGTGLGLPLCKMFAELHGGKLAIGSAVGEGTTVRITFPASRIIKDIVA